MNGYIIMTSRTINSNKDYIYFLFRGVAMGSCVFWARVGGMVAPQILLLVSTPPPLFFLFYLTQYRNQAPEDDI